MIDPKKLNSEELADVILEVQRRTGYRFDVVDAYEIARNTIHKAELNGKDESYVPILLENELRDFLMRKQINVLGKWRKENGLQMRQEDGRISRLVV